MVTSTEGSYVKPLVYEGTHVEYNDMNKWGSGLLEYENKGVLFLCVYGKL